MPDNTPAHEACLRELAGLIERSTGEDGLHATTIPALHFSRLSAPMPLPARGVQEAALCLIVQGAKRAILAEIASRRAAADLFEGGLRGECVSDA